MFADKMAAFLIVVISLFSGLIHAQQHPNVVIMFADDLGYGDLAAYGHPTSTTPNLDALAAQGLTFTQFYTASPVCSPSRAALLTGRLQARTGIWPGVFSPPDKGGLPHNETTIAEMLKPLGYKSAIVGKWHLGVGEKGTYLPTNHGFDYYMGIPYSHDMCPCPICFYPKGHCLSGCDNGYSPCPIFENAEIVQQPADFTHLAEKYSNAATNFIKSNADNKNPFFLYMAFQHTHKPQFSGQSFVNTSIRGPFGDSLSELDWQVGQIMTTLKDAGVDKNTFVFFTADNGPSLHMGPHGGNGGLLRCGKGTTWEGGQREAAIAWWPEQISPGRRSSDLAATVDLLPTIAKITGATMPKVTLDGVDMSEILFNKGPSTRKGYIYYPKDPHPDVGIFAVRTLSYKAHYHQQGSHCLNTYPDIVCRSNYSVRALDPPLLYNLLNDPSEMYPIDPNSDEYKTAMKDIEDYKATFEKDMVWGNSQIGLGSSKDLNPCANPGCTPFPSCCKTQSREKWRSDLWHTTSSNRL